MNRFSHKLLLTGCMAMITLSAWAQTNTVEFGKNRIQYKNFKWRYYQTLNFNTYFNQNGLALGKYVAQLAEQELPDVEKFIDYGLRRRVNIVVYDNYGEMKQSNIGIGLEWQNTGGVTNLVNNKMIVYFNGDHADLRRQVREGIARVIMENMLFGDDIGEFAGNAVLLNLPQWFTDGFVAYAAQNWDVASDEKLKELLFTGRYQTFNQLALEHPVLAGHAFWFYIETRYGKDAVSYLLYISRMDRSLKRSFEQVLHQSFKATLQDFLTFNYRRFQQDSRGRRQSTRGTVVTTLETVPTDFYRFHPNPHNRDYAVVSFKKGIYRVLLYQGYFRPTQLLKSGVRQMEAQENPAYPQIAWDPRGTHVAVIYEKDGRLHLLIYDELARVKTKFDLPSELESINSFSYLPTDTKTLLLSAVKNGHSHIFTYNISNFKIQQITRGAYDEMDPSYVGFAKKSGILFSSNRPSPYAPDADTVLPHNPYNVFLISNWEKPDEVQISQLTTLHEGNARLPMQYDDTHFTFVSDRNGISNRYAGYFFSEGAGTDTLYYVGSDIYHNPDKPELDSALTAYGAPQPDSVKVLAITKDSSYTFPITNYSHGIVESNIAGQKQVISEVIRQGDFKRVFKLKADTLTLRRRNVSSAPTYFRKYERHADSVARGFPNYYVKPDTAKKQPDYFQSEFSNQPADTNLIIKQNMALEEKPQPVLKTARLFPYHLKFSSDYLVAQLDNSVLITPYQPYTGGRGPSTLSSPIYLQQPFNGLIQVGVSDLFEDIKFSGGFRFPSSFNGSEYFFAYENLKHRVDWKATYYRKVDRVSFVNTPYDGKLKTNLYQIRFTYPFDPVRSLRLTVGVRTDRTVLLAQDQNTLPKTPLDYVKTFGLMHLEYVYDNTINPAINIWNGLRYKLYMEMFPQLNGGATKAFTYNAGLDARYYQKIYKNFIWATRFAADLSWGNEKLLYYLGGVDNWLFPKVNTSTVVNPYSDRYAYQTLAVNLRGYNQNIKNGNNVMLLNTELRLPVFATFINQPINSNFIRNFELTSFFDVGTAWNQHLSLKDQNYLTYSANNDNGSVQVQLKNGVLGPFVGGYGFGTRTSIGGYFLRLDAAWPATVFFQGKPILYLALGVDF